MNHYRLMCFLFLFLLPLHVLAKPSQDNVEPPLRSFREMDAWLSDPKRPKVHLHPLPRLAPPSEPVLTSAEEQHIRDLIAQLAEIADPDYGFSPTMSGQDFAPVPEAHHAGAMLLTAHNLKHSPAVLELVNLGPRALPLLLQHVEDATPTHLTIHHDSVIGFMGYGHEMRFNPANPQEQVVYTRTKGERPPALKAILTSYTVKIGDICFHIIGQIVGRGYAAVRYQPTANIIINSPVADASLAQEVRAIWNSATPTRHLFRSLLTDYSCRGVYSGYSFDGWGAGSDLQCEAAMRLLYYFPAQTAAPIAARLHTLHVERTGPPDGVMRTDQEVTDQEMAVWTKRELANGVHTKDFIKAVAWCTHPHIRSEMQALFRKSTDTAVLLAVLTRLDQTQWPFVRKKLGAVLQRQPKEDEGWYGEGYNILVALRAFGGDKAKPLYQRYMARGSAQRSISVCEALRNTSGGWDRALLMPLLADKRRSQGYTHAVFANKDEPRLPIRVCDEAAEVLSQHRPDRKFSMVGSFAQLDEQIRGLTRHLQSQ